MWGGMTTVLSTADVHARDRLAYWRDAICDVFVGLDCAPLARGAFRGCITTQDTGPATFSEVASQPQHVVRSRRQIAKSSDDFYLVSLQLAGEGFVQQDGREAHLRPGDLALYDSTRPYVLHFEGDFRQLVLQAPRAALRSRLGAADNLTAVAIPGAQGVGRLVSEALRGIGAEIVRLDGPTADRLAENALDLLATGLGAALPNSAPADSARRTLHVRRIKSYVQARLGDPALSPATIAAAAGVSPRYLHRLFEAEEQSIGRWIWAVRLEHCHRDLADPAQAGRSVTDIAFAWGFNDIAHFSRSFRARYGESPRAFRARQFRAPVAH
jgi:AraC-like DNA-binding protein